MPYPVDFLLNGALSGRSKPPICSDPWYAGSVGSPRPAAEASDPGAPTSPRCRARSFKGVRMRSEAVLQGRAGMSTLFSSATT